MKSLLVFTVLLVLAACTANPSPAAAPTPGAIAVRTPLPIQSVGPIATPVSPTAMATAVAPTATHVPIATAAPSSTPAPTGDAAYDAFARRLKAAIETDDEAALRDLMVPRWIFGPRRGGSAASQGVDEALSWFRAARPNRPQTSYVVDLMRRAWNPFGTQPQTWTDRHVLVARWQDEQGHEAFDELHAQRVDGQWRWTALLKGATYYHSPPLSVFRANPWGFFDMLLVGEYRGKNIGNDIPEEATDAGRDMAFVLKDFSGTAMWVRYYTDVVTFPFQPDDPANIGRHLIVFGQPELQQWYPVFVHAHSVIEMSDDNYLVVTGTVETISVDKRSLTLMAHGSAVNHVVLLETTNLDRTDGCPAPLSGLMAGSRITVLGRPAPGNTILAEQIYVMPTTGPDWSAANHIQVFFDGQLYHRHDLRANSETTFDSHTRRTCN